MRRIPGHRTPQNKLRKAKNNREEASLAIACERGEAEKLGGWQLLLGA